MLGDLSGISKLYLITGRTDMRLSINGLMAIIRDTYQMVPYASAIYLFCGRRSDRLKALYHDKTGFVLLYMRLDCGCFQWPRNAAEARVITRQEYRWLMEGLSIDQPRALRPSPKKISSSVLYKTEKLKDFFPSGNQEKPRLSTRPPFCVKMIHQAFSFRSGGCL